MSKIKEIQTEIANMIREFLADLYSKRETPDSGPIDVGGFFSFPNPNAGALKLGQHLRENRYLQVFKFRSNDSIIDSLKKLVDDSEEISEDLTVGEVASYWASRYEESRKKPKVPLLISMFLCATAMASGIIALLVGSILPCNTWGWSLMIGESTLAAFALGWTVFVVIRMLAEPEEPKAKE